MKDAISKYYWLIFLGILPVLIILPISGNFELMNYFKAVLFAVIFPLLVAILMAILEVKIFKGYYDNLNNKISRIFDVQKQSARLSKMKIGKYDLLIKITEDSNLPIEFHIPKNQIDKMKHKPNFNYHESNIKKIQTYLIETSSSFFVKKNMRKIEREIEKVINIK